MKKYNIYPNEGKILNSKTNRELGYVWGSKPYVRVTITNDDGTHTSTTAHRIIWEYVNGTVPEGYEIHHKDHNPTNNCIDNLVLVSKEEHKIIHQKKKWSEEALNKKHKALIQLTKDGKLVREWKGTKEVQEEKGWCRSNITRCCRGKSKTAYGHIWKYKL